MAQSPGVSRLANASRNPQFQGCGNPASEGLRLAGRMHSAESIIELDRRLGIPGVAQIVEGNGGLPKVRITSAAAEGDIYLHGAHVTSWHPSGFDEALFVSSESRWEDGRAIRGGVPICLPWFGDKADDPKAPAHGFVRTKSWELDEIAAAGDVVTICMSTGSDAGTKRWWPFDFRLSYRATFGPELRMELELQNTGTSVLRFAEALHSYLKVSDVRSVSLHGLDGVKYVDKTDAGKEQLQNGDVLIAGETDRVYLDTLGEVALVDTVAHRRLQVAKENSLTTVVWNPWEEKAAAMADLGDDEWKQMICVETSNVLGYAVEVAPGQQHRMTSVLTLAGS